MPKGARKKSESGIYHIVLRGINKQTLFYDEEDIGGQVYKGVQTAAARAATKAAAAASKVNTPDLGNKLDYAFGKAGGSAHNIQRSADNMTQLGKIGIHDNACGHRKSSAKCRLRHLRPVESVYGVV
jgi:hypothetical protein